jgi:hypothetical protein
MAGKRDNGESERDLSPDQNEKRFLRGWDDVDVGSQSGEDGTRAAEASREAGRSRDPPERERQVPTIAL